MTDPDRRDFLQHAAGALAAMAFTPTLAELSPMSGNTASLSIALIGAGRQGRAMMVELGKMEGIELVAVCDTDVGRRKKAGRRVRGLRTYETYSDLLEKESDVQAVIVATPTHLHRQIAIDALSAGKHVYCEAPLASTVEDSAAIVAAARKSNRVFAVGLLARSNPVYALARSFFRSGTLRDLACLRAQNFKKTSWVAEAPDAERKRLLNWRLDPALSLGLPGEEGTHQFDAFHWFLGKYPVSVRGTGGVRVHKDGREVADTALCELAFDDGLRLSWQSTLGSSYSGRFELYSGSMATLKMAWTAGWMFKEADSPIQGWEVYANRQVFHNDEGITLIADATKLAAQGKLKDGVGLPNPPVHYGLADFLKSCTEGTTPACGADEGHRATVVGILASQAVTSGEELAIDPKLFEVR
jgi:predicted dehydrogenase